jgi:hypothetical protein
MDNKGRMIGCASHQRSSKVEHLRIPPRPSRQRAIWRRALSSRFIAHDCADIEADFYRR